MKKTFHTALALLLLAAPVTVSAATETEAVSESTAKNEAAPTSAGAQASPDNIKVYFVSPFKHDGVASILMKKDWKDVKKSYDTDNDYDTFDAAVSKIIKKGGLCQNAVGSTYATKLKDCANKYPDEFAAATSQLQAYMSWKDVEIRTFLMLYADKRKSTVFRDRIEARLMTGCIQNTLDDSTDSAGTIEKCRQAVNWDLSDLFAGINASVCSTDPTTGTTGAASETTFSYAAFVRNCVANDKLTTGSDGVKLAAQLVPDAIIKVNKKDGGGSVSVEIKPSSLSPAAVYAIVYTRLVGNSLDQTTDSTTKSGILFSEWFLRGASGGKIPSAFATNDFNPSNPKHMPYMSIGIPPKLLSSIANLPTGDRDFFIEMLARKVALIQSLEIMRGAQTMTLESQRALASSDKELGDLTKAIVEYFDVLVKGYESAMKVSSTQTIGDILWSLEQLKADYQKVEAGQQRAKAGMKAEIKRKIKANSGK